jgi:tetratricopeptide (TPR) repeat protein
MRLEHFRLPGSSRLSNLVMLRTGCTLLAMLIASAVPCGPLAGAELPVNHVKTASAAPPDTSTISFAHGSFLAMKGDYWGAIDRFRKLKPPLQQDAAAVQYSISKAFSSLGVPDSARVHGEAAFRLDPGNQYYARHLARIAHDMQDYDRAAALYGQAVLDAPTRTDLLTSQALEYMAANKPAESLELYEKVLKLNPFDEKALSQSLSLQIALKRYPEAIVTLKQLVGLIGSSPRLQLALGELFDLAGQGDLAVETFRGIIAADRKSPSVWAALLDHYIRSGNRDQMISEFRAYDHLAPADPGPAIVMANHFALLADRDTTYVRPVTMMLDDLGAHHPRDSRVYVLRGTFEMARKRTSEAIANFNRAVQLAPGKIVAWEGLVMAYLERQDKAMVFRTISRARQALPRQSYHLNILEGYALLHTGSPVRSVRLLESVIASKKGAPDHDLLIQANTSLAMAYEELGRKKLSGEAYSRVLELDPHNALAMNNLAYLYTEEGVMLRKALRLSMNAVLLDPENGVFLDTLGWVYYRLGNYAVSREVLEKAVATGIEESEVFGHLGAVYEKLGETDKAREMFDRAKAMKGKKAGK